MNPFEALGLGQETLNALKDLGFQEPTPVQQNTIPLALSSDKDLTVLAQTGTGKTAAFGLPLLELVDPSSRSTQCLVLAPTRELCVQISKDLMDFAKYRKGISVVAVYGGANIRTQMSQLSKGAHIIVATPGRLLDLINRRAVRLESTTLVVLDEADEMLNMGFQEDLTSILENTPKEKKTWLFSATMNKDVKRIAKGYMNASEEVVIGRENSASSQIEHKYCVVHGKDKHPALRRFIDWDPEMFAIVFCRTKLGAQRLAERLIKEGYDADSLHGDLSQDQRDKVMGRYRQRTLQLLIATDVAARGIDVNEVTHVIHYDLPNDIESYTHRSGRTGRAGKKGISLSILGKGEVRKIKQFQSQLKATFTHVQVPDGSDICERQLMSLIKKIKQISVNTAEIARFMPAIEEQLGDLPKSELMERLVAIEFNRFLEQYRNAKDLNISLDKNDARSNRRNREDGETKQLFLNLGRADGFDRGRMLAHLCNTSSMDGDSFGRIDLQEVFTTVEVNEQHFGDVLASFHNQTYQGRPVEAREADDNRRGRAGRGRSRSNGPRGGGNRSGGRGYKSKTRFGGKERAPFKRTTRGESSNEDTPAQKKKRSFKGVGGKKKSAHSKTKGKPRNKYKNLKKS
jgi:ATP-dependent RNA helicase DeaD